MSPSSVTAPASVVILKDQIRGEQKRQMIPELLELLSLLLFLSFEPLIEPLFDDQRTQGWRGGGVGVTGPVSQLSLRCVSVFGLRG